MYEFGARVVDPNDPEAGSFIPVPLHVPPVLAAAKVIGRSA